MSAPQITVTIVGSGAVRANPKRGGTCQLVRVGEENLLFDCGRLAGHNLHNFGCPPEAVSRVFLTHLHFDHVCDLALLLLLSWTCGRARRLPVHGPPGTREFLEHGVRRAYRQDIESRLGHGRDPAGLEWEAIEIAADGPVLEAEGCTVSALATGHGGMPNYNYRIDAGGKRVVITSDTEPAESLVPFCEGADLLVVECSGTREFLGSVPWGGWHMSPESVADLAKRASVSRVVIKHLVIEDWTQDPDISAKMAARIRELYGGPAQAAEDGLTIEL